MAHLDSLSKKSKISSCHFLKIYMKISLNARRTSPPLNIAQNSKISRHLNFIFQYNRRIASSLLSNFESIHNQLLRD